jgi:hypothetical protein
MNPSTNNPRDTGPAVSTPTLFLTPQALFEREQLPFPPVPPALAKALRLQQDAALFSTRPLAARPYHLEPFLAEVAAHPELPAYATIGFDGHGFNSWAAHCFVVTDALALFIQLPWGGAYTDAERARADIADLFAWADQLQAKVQLAHEQQKIPAGRRLQVAASRLGTSGWRWLMPGADNTNAPWNEPAGMKAALLQLLDDVLSGKKQL